MPAHRIFSTPFASVYPLYVAKAERKGRTQEEVDRVICWLTGYDQAGLLHQIDQKTDFEAFFAQAVVERQHQAGFVFDEKNALGHMNRSQKSEYRADFVLCPHHC